MMAEADGVPHPLDYDDAPVPLRIRPLAWLAYALCACLVPVKVLILLVLGCAAVPVCAVLPQKRVAVPMRLLLRVAMACFGVLPGCLTVDDRRSPADAAAPAPIVVLAPHCGLLEGFFGGYWFWSRAVMMAPYARIPLLRSIVAANRAVLVSLRRHETRKVSPDDASPKKSSAAREAIAAHVLPPGVLARPRATRLGARRCARGGRASSRSRSCPRARRTTGAR